MDLKNNNSKYKIKSDDDKSCKTLSKDRLETQTIKTESDIEIETE